MEEDEELSELVLMYEHACAAFYVRPVTTGDVSELKLEHLEHRLREEYGIDVCFEF